MYLGRNLIEIEAGEGNTYSRFEYSYFLNAYFAIVVTSLALKVFVFTSVVHASRFLDKKLGRKLGIVFYSQLQATNLG